MVLYVVDGVVVCGVGCDVLKGVGFGCFVCYVSIEICYLVVWIFVFVDEVDVVCGCVCYVCVMFICVRFVWLLILVVSCF